MNIEQRFWTCLFTLGPIIVIIWLDYAIKRFQTNEETITIVNHLQQVSTITRRTSKASAGMAWFYTVAFLSFAFVLIVYGGPVQR